MRAKMLLLLLIIIGRGAIEGFNLGTSFRNTRAFSVVMEDGTIRTWGYSSHGGTSQPSGVSNVKTVFSTYRAFCALHNLMLISVTQLCHHDHPYPRPRAVLVEREIHSLRGVVAVHE